MADCAAPAAPSPAGAHKPSRSAPQLPPETPAPAAQRASKLALCGIPDSPLYSPSQLSDDGAAASGSRYEDILLSPTLEMKLSTRDASRPRPPAVAPAAAPRLHLATVVEEGAEAAAAAPAAAPAPAPMPTHERKKPSLLKAPVFSVESTKARKRNATLTALPLPHAPAPRHRVVATMHAAPAPTLSEPALESLWTLDEPVELPVPAGVAEPLLAPPAAAAAVAESAPAAVETPPAEDDGAAEVENVSAQPAPREAPKAAIAKPVSISERLSKLREAKKPAVVVAEVDEDSDFARRVRAAMESGLPALGTAGVMNSPALQRKLAAPRSEWSPVRRRGGVSMEEEASVCTKMYRNKP
jgi:hypothetical protein